MSINRHIVYNRKIYVFKTVIACLMIFVSISHLMIKYYYFLTSYKNNTVLAVNTEYIINVYVY